MLRILNTIGKKYSPTGKEILGAVGQIDYLEMDQKKFGEIAFKYDGFIVGLGLNITKEIIETAKNLKFIATATTGLDHIDIGYAAKKGIKILSLRGEDKFLDTITGTAELALGLAIDLMRGVSVGFESVKKGQWDREKFRGHSLAGKTLGIVGLGRLGKMMAHYGKAFGMNVAYCDPSAGYSAYKKVGFDELLRTSDVISIHVHLMPQTENLFNKRAFEKMKRSAFLINTSRGKIVNEKDLLSALKAKKFAGYATDVLADELNYEKKIGKNPLVEYAKKNSNVLVVPHLGGMTYESREATDIFIAKKLKNFLQTNVKKSS